MKPYAIGIDVGGTVIKTGLVNQQGKVLAKYTTRVHSEQQPEFVIDAIAQAYLTILEQSKTPVDDIEAIGLGFGGNINGAIGLVLVSSILPAWNHIPLRDIVARRTGQRVILENDTNVCALGEYRYGAGRGSHNMCYVTFSTGFGIGIIIQDRLYVGHTGTAGELGHVVIEIGGPPCSCGKKGCLMAYASSAGISRMVYEQLETGVSTRLRRMTPPDGRYVSGEIVAEAARQGDDLARQILYTAGYYAGVGLSIIIQVLNPEVIVFGGGLSRIGALVMEPVQAGMWEHTQPELLDSMQLVPWQLGDDIGIIGAAANVFSTSGSFIT